MTTNVVSPKEVVEGIAMKPETMEEVLKEEWRLRRNSYLQNLMGNQNRSQKEGRICFGCTLPSLAIPTEIMANQGNQE